jgi:hypothetical protein
MAKKKKKEGHDCGLRTSPGPLRAAHPNLVIQNDYKGKYNIEENKHNK